MNVPFAVSILSASVPSLLLVLSILLNRSDYHKLDAKIDGKIDGLRSELCGDLDAIRVQQCGHAPDV